MLKSKAKGLFIDISEFSLLGIRTSGYKFPIKIEQIEDFPITGDFRSDDVRAFLEKLIDFRGNKYHVARCGIYPKSRFVYYYETESLAKVKNQDFLYKVLQSEYDIDLNKNSVSILNANDGSDFNSANNASKELIFCGGPLKAFQEAQDQVLSYGIYPDRLELSSITTLGGICNYLRLNKFESSAICVELTSDSIYASIINQGNIAMTRPMSFGLDSIFPVLQQELGLRDEMSARKLFYTNTFDVAEMGKKLLMPILKELQAISGYYEVQTGLTVDHVFVSVLPRKLDWVTQTISDSLGLEVIQPDFKAWLESLHIKAASGVDLSNLESRWLGVFSLMGDFT